jgi:hypothetical protein
LVPAQTLDKAFQGESEVGSSSMGDEIFAFKDRLARLEGLDGLDNICSGLDA